MPRPPKGIRPKRPICRTCGRRSKLFEYVDGMAKCNWCIQPGDVEHSEEVEHVVEVDINEIENEYIKQLRKSKGL